MNIYRNQLKRLFDFIAALIVLTGLLPLFLLLWLILVFEHSGHPLFIQVRPGRNEKGFRMYKFKTMTDARDEDGNLLPNFQRITPFGRFMRKFSLDELPQLFNVLTGQMSLIGPRPLLFKYLPLYSTEQRKRHDVRPGITGWAQVNGRNAISWTQKFGYDVWYVENVSFSLDMKIIWKTVLKVIKSEGVNSEENITMPPFNGQN